jgi:hypothetical protein
MRHLPRARRTLAASVLAILLFWLAALAASTVPQALAATANTPSATLTYTNGTLAWTNAAGNSILDYKMDVFQDTYTTSSGKVIAKSKNGDAIVAPGTSGKDTIEVKNDTTHAVNATTVVYKCFKDTDATARASDAAALQQLLEEKVQVEATITTSSGTQASADAASIADKLPSGITPADVVCVATSDIDALSNQDVTVSWQWQFDVDAQGNITDTILGDAGTKQTVTLNPLDVQLGVIVLVDDTYVEPDGTLTPAGISTAGAGANKTGGLLQTGDIALIAVAICVVAIIAALVVIFATRHRRKE